MGWFGFNGGSVLALGSAKAVTTMSVVFVNTNMAAAAGCIAAMLYATLMSQQSHAQPIVLV